MNHNFQYLKYPSQLYDKKPKISQAIGVNLSGKEIRKLYYCMQFNQNQNNHIRQFKKYASKNNVSLNCNDIQILRYLYSGQFNYKQSLQKISIYLQWIQDPLIQTLTTKARIILNDGVIYTFGRDKQNRPVVYLDLSKIKFQRFTTTDYYCAINTLLNLVVQNCFVPGVIQTYLFVIDMGGKNFTSLPIQAIGTIIKKLSTVYSMYLGKMLVINTQMLVKFTYTAVKMFIHEETRKKITLLDKSQIQKMSQYIQRSQLLHKHNGLNPDMQQYWPPQVPGNKKIKFSQQQTIYYSIESNQSLFADNNLTHSILIQDKPGCCDNYCSANEMLCNIF